MENMEKINSLSSSALGSLINVGSDAQRNLYEASIRRGNSFDYSDSFSVRLETFEIPSFGASTVNLEYQNISLERVLPSSTLSNKLSLSFRLDGALQLYEELKNSLMVNALGNYDTSENFSEESQKLWTITIRALNPKALEVGEVDYSTVSTWAFNNCILTELPPLSFGYTQSGPFTVNCSFIFQHFEISKF